MKCPCCGYLIAATPRATKTTEPICLTADTSTMTDAAMRAYYKSTAAAGDALFFAEVVARQYHNTLDTGTDGAIALLELRRLASSLALEASQGLKRADVYARLLPLQATWRARERRYPAQAQRDEQQAA